MPVADIVWQHRRRNSCSTPPDAFISFGVLDSEGNDISHRNFSHLAFNSTRVVTPPLLQKLTARIYQNRFNPIHVYTTYAAAVLVNSMIFFCRISS